MRFYQYKSLESLHRARGPIREASLAFLDRDPYAGPIRAIEREWQTDRRPYYRIWPGVMRPLLSLRLERVECQHIRLPIRSLCLEMPAGRSLAWGEHEVAAVLCCRDAGGIRILVTASDPNSNSARYELDLPASKLIENQLPEGTAKTDESITGEPPMVDVIRMVCCVCLIGSDPAMVVPRVLDADREKWEQTHSVDLIAKARRRGNLGWDLGRDLSEPDERAEANTTEPAGERTVSPHYRHAHAALVWTGHGRQVPRIILRRGSFVRGASLTQVPQGFHGDAPPPCPICLRPMSHESGRWLCEDCASRTWAPSGSMFDEQHAGQIRGSKGRVIRDTRGLS